MKVFGVQPTKYLAGHSNFFKKQRERKNYHELLFSDSEFYALYIQELEKLTEKNYLPTFFKTTEKDLQEKIAIINNEFPYKRFEKKLYHKNIKNIKRILDIKRGVHATYELANDSLYLYVANATSLPMQLKNIKSGDDTIELKDQPILSCKEEYEFMNYEKYVVAFSQKKAKNLMLNYSILGSNKNLQTELRKFHVYSPEESTILDSVFSIEDVTIEGVTIDSLSQTVFFSKGNIEIKQTISIPEGYKLVIDQGASIEFFENAKIISKGAIEARGTSEHPIVITASGVNNGFILDHVSERSVLNFVHVKKLTGNSVTVARNGVFNFIESNAQLNNFLFEDISHGSVVYAYRSSIYLNQISFTNISNTGIIMEYSMINYQNANFSNVNSGIELRGCTGELTNLHFDQIEKTSIELKSSSNVTAKNIHISNSGESILIHKNSKLSLSSELQFDNVEKGVVDKNEK